MDEIAKAGGNYPKNEEEDACKMEEDKNTVPKNEEENTCKMEEDTNTVQVDLLMRTNTAQAVLLMRT